MQKFKSLRRPTQALIIFALIASIGVAAYAAFSKLATSNTATSSMSKENFVAVELEVSELTGTIALGDSKSISAIVSKPGTAEGLAFIRFQYPTISSASGMAGSAYTWSVNSGWSAVEEGIGYSVYGYSSPLDADGSTSSLMDSLTMKNMSTEDYKSLTDVNVSMVGYVADCSEYGTEIDAAWSQIGQ